MPGFTMPRALTARIALLFGLSAGLVLAQQDKGDKEFGIDGAATVSNNSPVTGTIFAELSFGKYLSATNYVGVIAAPQFNFSGSTVSGGALLGGEYRYLFGSAKKSRVWPFIGAQADYDYLRSNGTSTNVGVVAPEFGLKFYVSQKTAFELSYLLEIQVGGGAGGGFGDRSLNLVVFGFKHIF